MFNLSFLKPKTNVANYEALVKENEYLKQQIKELLALDETGFFIELDSLLKAILKKALVMYNCDESFFSLIGKTQDELNIRLKNNISDEKMNKIKEGFKNEYNHWVETEAKTIKIDDFILLPLVRRHKILGVIGLKTNSDLKDSNYEILHELADKTASSLESAILYEKMFKRLLTLSNVFIFGREIVANIDLKTLVDKFLKIAIEGTDCEIGCLYLFHEKIELPYFVRLFSSSDKKLSFNTKSLNGYTDLIKAARKEAKVITVNSFQKSEYRDTEIEKIENIIINDTVIIPLIPRETLLGVIQVCNKHNNSSFTNEDLDLLKILASQVAFVIQNTELFNNLEKAYIDTLSALTNAIDAKDSYTRGHSDRVTDLSVRLAKEVGIESKEVERIRLGGMLHDIGKIGIPELILNKPGRLDDHEFEVIKSHPVLGVGILGDVEFLQNVVPIIKHHHERYDGRGYPDKLKGTEIPYYARIVSIADTYDAMTTTRPYRKALTIEESLKEIEKCKGSQFDPELADIFIKMIRRDGR